MRNILICEDAPEQRESLERMIQAALESLNVAGRIVFSTGNPKDAYAFSKSCRVDIAFLDIELASTVNGISLAKKLQMIHPGIGIVFITCHEEFAYQGFVVHALDYLMKPVSPSMIRCVLSRVFRVPANEKDCGPLLDVRLGRRILQLRPESVLMIEKQRNKAIITGVNGIYNCYETLASLGERLAEHGFVQAHRGFLVNMNRIAVVDFHRKEILLDSGHVCPIGGQYAHVIRQWRETC